MENYELPGFPSELLWKTASYQDFLMNSYGELRVTMISLWIPSENYELAWFPGEFQVNTMSCHNFLVNS